MIEVDGGVSKFTVPLDDVCTVSIGDFAKLNAERAGMRDAFPNVFKL